MKNNMLPTAAALAAIAAAPVMAGEPAPVPVPTTSAITADLTLGYHSDYSYRGVVFDDALTDDVFTFGVGLTYDDGGGNQFFADLYYRNLDSGFSEGFLSPQFVSIPTAPGLSDGFFFRGIDDHVTVTAGVRRELLPNLTGTLAYAFNSGGIYVDFDSFSGGDDNGHELQAKLDYAVTPDFVVYGLAAYEFNDSLDGFYLEAGAAYNYQVTDQVSVVASAALAASFGYLPEQGLDNDGLNHFELRVSVPVAVTTGLTITPYVSYVGALDVLDDYEAGEAFSPFQDDAVIGGVEAILTF